MEKKVLFKGLNKAHLQTLKMSGCVHIGSLYYYRDLEGRGGDPEESLSGVEINSKGSTFSLTGDELGSILGAGNIVIEGKGSIQFCGGKMTVSGEFKNVYVYCVSAIKLKDYEVHFGVKDLHKFGCLLFSELKKVDKQIKEAFLGKVLYYEKHPKIENKEDYDKVKNTRERFVKLHNLIDGREIISDRKDLISYFNKSKSFEPEKEYRFVFISDKNLQDFRYLDIKCDPEILNKIISE